MDQDNKQYEENAECIQISDALCTDAFSVQPETGIGALPPLNPVEKHFNTISKWLLNLSIIPMILTTVMITADILGRLLLNHPINGITDLETLLMSVVGFGSMAYVLMQRQPIQIDIFYDHFPDRLKRILYLLGCLLSGGITLILSYLAIKEGIHWQRITSILKIEEWPFVLWSGIGLGLAFIAFFFQTIQILRVMIKRHEFAEIVFAVGLAVLIAALPYLYKHSGIKLSFLAIGGLGFLVLLILVLLRIPMGYAMSLIGLLGLLVVTKRPSAAYGTIGSIPFTETTTFLMISLPMFMLMGDMVSLAGLSEDLFVAAKRWLG
ncbi:MAG: TRAP transporter small permease, partial [Mailhella sp.]|nr:TRAP transporter small permease [Mailhella sp.]